MGSIQMDNTRSNPTRNNTTSTKKKSIIEMNPKIIRKKIRQMITHFLQYDQSSS